METHIDHFCISKDGDACGSLQAVTTYNTAEHGYICLSDYIEQLYFSCKTKLNVNTKFRLKSTLRLISV